MVAENEPITILLVDNDADCRMIVRDAIANCKISNRIYEVANGREALDFVFQRGNYANAPRPGLIYLDIEMPGLSGQDVLKTIKTAPTHCDIPIVMMTGVSDEQQMEQAVQRRQQLHHQARQRGAVYPDRAGQHRLLDQHSPVSRTAPASGAVPGVTSVPALTAIKGICFRTERYRRSAIAAGFAPGAKRKAEPAWKT